MNVNLRIKQLRKHELRLSMDNFANEIGFSRATISKVESESMKVTSRLILAIHVRFKVNEKWLTTGEGDIFEKTPERFVEVNKKVQFIKDEIETLNDQQQDLLIDFIKLIKKTP